MPTRTSFPRRIPILFSLCGGLALLSLIFHGMGVGGTILPAVLQLMLAATAFVAAWIASQCFCHDPELSFSLSGGLCSLSASVVVHHLDHFFRSLPGTPLAHTHALDENRLSVTIYLPQASVGLPPPLPLPLEELQKGLQEALQAAFGVVIPLSFTLVEEGPLPA